MRAGQCAGTQFGAFGRPNTHIVPTGTQITVFGTRHYLTTILATIEGQAENVPIEEQGRAFKERP